jgi:glucose-6-phosphate isomerase
MAVAGVDIVELLRGAARCEKSLREEPLPSNPAVLYAVDRNLLFAKGFTVESLVTFEPDLDPFARWWTQLFAETEGKTPNAIFPTSFRYSEDLHAVGQYVQEGRRCIAQTYLRMFHRDSGLRIDASVGVDDGFGYLDGMPFDELNRAMYRAAIEAHSDGGVPCLEIAAPDIAAQSLGGLFYFFMFSAYLSACLIGVNPFTQDGVESYKKAMYAILGKRG